MGTFNNIWNIYYIVFKKKSKSFCYFDHKWIATHFYSLRKLFYECSRIVILVLGTSRWNERWRLYLIVIEVWCSPIYSTDLTRRDDGGREGLFLWRFERSLPSKTHTHTNARPHANYPTSTHVFISLSLSIHTPPICFCDNAKNSLKFRIDWKAMQVIKIICTYVQDRYWSQESTVSLTKRRRFEAATPSMLWLVERDPNGRGFVEILRPIFCSAISHIFSTATFDCRLLIQIYLFNIRLYVVYILVYVRIIHTCALFLLFVSLNIYFF